MLYFFNPRDLPFQLDTYFIYPLREIVELTAAAFGSGYYAEGSLQLVSGLPTNTIVPS